jgi:outer membrane protein
LALSGLIKNNLSCSVRVSPPGRIRRFKGFELSLKHLGRILLAVLAIFIAVHGFAAPVSISQLSEKQALTAVRQLVSSGEFDIARTLIAAYQPHSPNHLLRQQLVEAMILESQEDFSGAALQYRKILADRPDFTLAKVRLSKVLAAAGDDDAARFQLGQLIAAGVDDRMDGQLKSLLNGLDERRPLKFGGFFSLLPSTNINTGTDNSTVSLGGIPLSISDESRRKSGVGIIFGGNVVFQQRFQDKKTFLASASFVHRFYPALKTHATQADVSIGVAQEFQRGKASLSVIAGAEFANAKQSSKYAGMRLDAAHSIAPRWRMSNNFSLRHRWHEDNQLRTGYTFAWQSNIDFTTAPSRFYRLILGTEFQRSAAARYSYDEGTVGAGFYNEFAAGLTVYSEASASLRRYKAVSPGMTELRSDRLIAARVVITKRDFNIAGFAPRLAYSYTRNFSNSVFDDYQKHDIDLRLTKDF